MSKYLPNFFFIVAVAILFSAGSAAAGATPRQGPAILLDSYQKNMAQLATSSFGLPLFLESSERGDKVKVDVYGIFDYPFASIANVLKVPANWCDIVSLHPNVKACTYRELPGDWLLTFYVGKKTYQAPEETRQVIYHFQNVVQQPDYLDILLRADAGPFGTEDHRLRFEALPLAKGGTFVHVSYEYNDSMALRLAGKAYFSTLGRGKVGFTVTGTDGNGQNIHIGGPRGAIERNAVRYYFAIQTFMSTLHHPEKSHFSIRTSQWFDLTTHYKKQLFDLERKDYLTVKAKEHKNQLLLQSQLRTKL
jgi:hypothetical protein